MSRPPPFPVPGIEPAAAGGRAQRIARIAVTSALVALGVWILWDFLPALAWAAVFAVATWPLYRRFCASFRRGNGFLPALVFTLLIGLLFVVPLAAAAVEVGREAHLLIRWIAAAQKHGLPVPDWVGELPHFGGEAADWWRANLSDPDGAADLLGRINRAMIFDWTRTLGLQLAHRLALLAFMLLTLFFLFRAGERLVAQLRLVGERLIGTQGERLAEPVIGAIHGTVNGLVLVGLGEGVVLALVYVAAGVPHPALVGALTGLLAIIPFGAPLVYSVAALMLLVEGAVGAAITVFVIGSLVVFVADHFVRPALIGGAVRLPFLWVLLGLLGGLETFGLLGLFLGPAIMAALVSLWREWTAPRPREVGEDEAPRAKSLADQT